MAFAVSTVRLARDARTGLSADILSSCALRAISMLPVSTSLVRAG